MKMNCVFREKGHKLDEIVEMKQFWFISLTLITALALFPYTSCLYHEDRSYLAYTKLVRGVHHKFDYIVPSRAAPLKDLGSISLMHIVCTEYIHINRATTTLNDLHISHGVYYSCTKDNLGCLLAAMDEYDKLALHKNSFVDILLLLPLDNIHKLDSSLLLALPWLKHSSKPSLLRDWLQQAHPIISHLRALSPLQLSVGYQPSWSNISQLHAAHTWFDPAYLSRETHSRLFSGNLASPHKTSLSNRGTSKSFLVSEVLTNSWKDFGMQTLSFEHDCNFSQYHQIKHRRNHIIISLTSQSLTEYSCLLQLIRGIASHKSVTSISLSPPMRLQNKNARAIIQSGQLNKEPWEALNLNGAGQVVGVSDTGIDENHCFFVDAINGRVLKSSAENPMVDHLNRKIVQYIAFSGANGVGDVNGGHGSHVAGSIAGDCQPGDTESNSIYHGVAREAKLAFFDIEANDNSGDLFIPADFKDLFDPAYMAGAKIHSNSWGGGFVYDSFCLDVDEYSYNHPDFLTFFAAGNDGGDGAYTILSPALAKNAVAVASLVSLNMNFISYFSAEGPCPDGRTKPDITTPGQYITSANASPEGSQGLTCGTASKSGTSMATPIAAGSAALIRQYFKDPIFWFTVCGASRSYSQSSSQFINFNSLCISSGTDISGAMLKALMLQSGLHMSNEGVPPDVRQGYGRVTLSNVLPLPNTDQLTSLFIDEPTLASFEERIYSISITHAGNPIKATISWFDPPNLEFAAKVLLHDLDLVLTAPDDTNYFGNYKSGRAAYNDSSLRDDLNNNEQILVAYATIGTWTLRIQSKLLTQANEQSVSLVVTCDGYVTHISNEAVAPSLFSRCPTSGLSVLDVQTELEFSLFDFVGMDGWKTGNKFKIISSADSIVFSGSLRQGSFYDFRSACLTPGMYLSELVLDSSGPDYGVQASIPHCQGLFLAPLASQQYFTISNIIESYSSDQHANDNLFVKGQCRPAYCSVDTNGVELAIELYEGGGVGWSGAYYTLVPYDTPLSDELVGPSGLHAGTLEWGYYKVSKLCLNLPINSLRRVLYEANDTLEDINLYMMLSNPTVQLPDLDPQLAFSDATHISGSFLDICPYKLDLRTPLIHIQWTAAAPLTLNLFFLSLPPSNFGQSKTTLSEYQSQLSGATPMGNCSILLSMPPSASPSLSMPPSASPSPSPTLPPSNISPTSPTLSPVTAPIIQPIKQPSQQPSQQPSEQSSQQPFQGNGSALTSFPTSQPSTISMTSSPVFTESAKLFVVFALGILQLVIIFLAIRYLCSRRVIDDNTALPVTTQDVDVLNPISSPSLFATTEEEIQKDTVDAQARPNRTRPGAGYELVQLDRSEHVMDISEHVSSVPDDEAYM